MTDKFELDKKFQALPEHAQVRAAEALMNTLSQGVDADAQSSEQIGRCIKKAFIALFEGEGGSSQTEIQSGIININCYPGLCVTGSLRSNVNGYKHPNNSSC